MKQLYGAVEAGGTKFVCGIGTGPDDIVTEKMDTRDPETTLKQVIDFFKEPVRKQGVVSLGIGSFGPVCLDKNSERYGFITTTPKPGWQDVDICGRLKQELGIPVGFDTDVNAAALGESLWGAGAGCSSIVYITVGTGIGAGVMINNTLVHGILHPEAGHIFLPKDPEDSYEGACPWHRDRCFEGLASGTALKGRTGRSGEEISDDHPVWSVEAGYVSKAVINYTAMLSPEKVILGGGVMQKKGLIEMIREGVISGFNGYLDVPEISVGIESYIVSPGLGDRAGVLGALAIGQRVYS